MTPLRIDKQRAALGEAGSLIRRKISFDQVKKEGAVLIDDTYPLQAGATEATDERYIFVEALGLGEETREVKIHLESGDPKDFTKPDVDVVFSVGFFDFPMIDNTRLSDSQRVAVSLTRWSDLGREAELAMAYFPGSRASLKEKQYYDELIEHLSETRDMLLRKEEDR